MDRRYHCCRHPLLGTNRNDILRGIVERVLGNPSSTRPMLRIRGQRSVGVGRYRSMVNVGHASTVVVVARRHVSTHGGGVKKRKQRKD